jgi:hypothetical protein
MVMHYFGGGIGHLKNTPPQQAPGFDPINPSSEEMEVEEEDNDNDPCSGTNEDLGAIVQQPSRDVIMNSGEREVGEDDEEDSDDGDGGGDQTDEDEDDESGHSGDEGEEGENNDGYASP